MTGQSVETLKPEEFTRRYGSQLWVRKDTQMVLVAGSESDLMGSLGGSGFVAPYGVFSSRRGSEAVLSRDATDYRAMVSGALGGLTDGAVGTRVFDGLTEGIDIRGAVDSMVPDGLKRLGATLPLGRRDHARMYRLPDGRYAAEVHQDPGISEYYGKGVADGDLSCLLTGTWKAIKYHYIDPLIDKYRGMLTQWLNSLINPDQAGRGSPRPAVVYV